MSLYITGPFYARVQELIEHIEYFPTRLWKQARFGYLSPAAFTQRYMQIASLLYPLGYAIANRPHCYLYPRINAR